jgi:ankyrin repeat protein
MKKSQFVLFAILLLFAQLAWSSEIHKAAEAGNLPELMTLLAASPQAIEERDENGLTPLLMAAKSGQREIVQFLAEKGADLKAVNARGNTALHLAAWSGYVDLVDYFLTKGIDINARSLTGWTPLLHAISMEHADVVKLLLAKGADIKIAENNYGGTAIHWSCNKNNQEIRELLLAAGADLNAVSPTDGSTPIFWATYAGNNGALTFLLDHGVDINSTIQQGWTPLLNAIGQGRLETVRLLLQRGAKMDGQTANSESPLMAAVQSNNDSLVKLLIDAGADINKSDSNGFVPLHFAAMNGNIDLMKILLGKGAKIESATNGGFTSLGFAVMRGHAAAAQMLIDNGAKVDQDYLNRDGCAPLREAIVSGYDSIVSMILSYNIDFNQKDEHYKRTVLHWAAIKGDKSIAEILLKHGTDINQKDSAGCTPLYYAGKYGHKDVADFLIANGGKADKFAENYINPDFIKSDLKPGEAQIWYLGHCGYAIKTATHFLIFDYYNSGKNPANPGLINGHIDPSEIAGENVLVFVTHEHADHYDTSIYNWKNGVKNIKYIYGFNPAGNGQTSYSGPEYQYLAPRQNQSVDNVTINTIAANDGGVGFLVEVDGLKIYHAGDHAGWAAGQRDGYIGEIDYLSGLTSNIDLAFLNATGCHSHDSTALADGTIYTLNKLNPGAWFPTHGLDHEYVYTPFVGEMAKKGSKAEAICLENRGDLYIYRKIGIH